MGDSIVRRWVNKYTISPSDLQPGDASVVKIVAVNGVAGTDWAAYMGWSDWTDEEVANTGDKISETAARDLFPSFAVGKGKIYRR